MQFFFLIRRRLCQVELQKEQINPPIRSRRFHRLLRSTFEDGWPEVQGDLHGPESLWSDDLFDWAIKRVHEGRAPGHNGIQVELYKYSKWARSRLRTQLREIWETGTFPEEMITGVATPCFKQHGDPNDYGRYRILVVFPAEYKIFSTMMYKHIINA